MRVALIGLGDIARKAYLPIIAARADVELLLCTRNSTTLAEISRTYRIPNATTDLNRLLEQKPEAAFIHAATEAHVTIAEKLLRHGIAVYVDKPLAYSYRESRRLVELAEQQGQLLMVGFNRRFAPMYRRLKGDAAARLVLMQKHRTLQPDYARRFIFDDFIHVVDTLRYLAPTACEDLHISAYHKDGLLYHLTAQLSSQDCTLIGIMNRDSGATEETLEFISPGSKWVVRGLSSSSHYAGGQERRDAFNDWDPVLYRRGFQQIIDHFLTCASEQRRPLQSAADALETHRICEQIVGEAERAGATPWSPARLGSPHQPGHTSP